MKRNFGLVVLAFMSAGFVPAFSNHLALSVETDSARGHWQLLTDYNTRTTWVNFYNHRDDLLYKESIKDRYFILTKRTARHFDKLLNLLLDHKLIGNKIKSHHLLVTNYWNPAKPNRPGPDDENLMPLTNELFVHLKVNHENKLQLSYFNPGNEQLLITIANDNSEYYHKEKSVRKSYSQLLSLDRLVSGTYRLELSGEKNMVRYAIFINRETQSIKLSERQEIKSR